MHNEDNKDNFPKKVALHKIPLYELLQLMEGLYASGADYVDIIGVSTGDDNTEDEIMVAVKDEYMNDKTGGHVEKSDDGDEANKMEGLADIIFEDEEEPLINPVKRLRDKDINDLLNNSL